MKRLGWLLFVAVVSGAFPACGRRADDDSPDGSVDAAVGQILVARGDLVSGVVRPAVDGTPASVGILVDGVPALQAEADRYHGLACDQFAHCNAGFTVELVGLSPGPHILQVERVAPDEPGEPEPLQGSPVSVTVVDPMDSDPARLLAYQLPDAEAAQDLTEWLWRHVGIDAETGIGFPDCEQDYVLPQADMGHWGLVPGAEHQGLYWTYPDALLMGFLDAQALGDRRYQCGTAAGLRFGPLFETTAWPVDRYGLLWWDRYAAVPAQAGPDSYVAGQGLAFPHYAQFSHCVGFEFNVGDGDPGNDGCAADAGDPLMGWVADTGSLHAEDGQLVVTATDGGAVIRSPLVALPASLAPFVQIQISCPSEQHLDGLTLRWEGGTSGQLTVDETTLPPTRYPDVYDQGIYRLYFPVHADDHWQGTVEQLVLVLPGMASGQRAHINFVRPSFDTRWPVGNALVLLSAPTLIGVDADSRARLEQMLPRLRRLAGFIVHQLTDADGLTLAAFRGFDGLGGQEGQSLAGSYFDMYPMGAVDLPSVALNAAALDAMATLERWAASMGIVQDPPLVDLLDLTPVPCPTDPALLSARAQILREQLAQLWVSETGRYAFNRDVDGALHDLGNVHHNLQAVALGQIADDEAAQILDWITGHRTVATDDSIGDDIYRYAFAPRARTVHDVEQFSWVWAAVIEQAPGFRLFRFGNQMLDGGAVGLTSFYELESLARLGRAEDLWDRITSLLDWYRTVRAAGGQGRAFYRAYYTENPFDDPTGPDPERGFLQGCIGQPVYEGGPVGTAGALGLDCEFMADTGVMTVGPLYALFGLSIRDENTLGMAPLLPSALAWMGARQLWFKGNRLTFTVSRDGTLDLRDSEILVHDTQVAFQWPQPGSFVREDGQTFPLEPTSEGAYLAVLPIVNARYAFHP